MLLVDVDDDLLDRLQRLAPVVESIEHLRSRNAELEALAAHGLDENGELQFAASGDDMGVGIQGRLDAKRDIALGLPIEPVANDAARHFVAFRAGEGAVVDGEGHRQGRRINRLGGERLHFLRVAERVGDVELLQAGDGDDVARDRFVDRRALDAAEGQDFRYAPLLDQIAVAVEHFDRRVGLDRAREDAAGDDPAEVGIGLEQRAEHAEAAGADLRRADVLEHEIEQGRHVVLGALGSGGHPALLGGAVDDGEVELLVGGVERGEEIEHLVDDLARARVELVDLVDADDGSVVCGIGPSAASTSTIAPSTIDRMRSTSPPKSAWPGVSTMLMRRSFHTTEVALARIVMPRSRSRSLESSTRSATR